MIEGLIESAPGLVAMRTVLARARLDAGETDHAAATLTELAAGGFAGVPPDSTYSSALAALAEVAAAVGDIEAAGPVRALLLRFSGQLMLIA